MGYEPEAVDNTTHTPLTHNCLKTYTSGMYHHPSSRRRLQSPERIVQGVLSHSFKRRCGLFSHVCKPCRRPTGNGIYRSIHVLDNDSLLNVFHHSQQVLLDQDEADQSRVLRLQGGEWGRERWWYKLVHVCRRWRYLVFQSTSHLGLHLVCTHGTPVADMLTHSPRLPLIIDYIDQGRGVTADEEEGIVLALQQRDRVRRIRLMMPVPELQRLIMAMEGEFPILEHLYMGPPTKHTTGLILPGTFQAHLRHLILINFAFSLGSPLLTNTTAAALVSLVLQRIHPSTYFRPNHLLQQLSLIPHLETFIIGFDSPVHNRNVERRLLRELVMTPIVLPNLRWLGFRGASAYLEAVLPHITTPLLERLEISFLNQLIISIPHILQFIDEAENSNFGSAVLTFHEESLCMNAHSTEGARVYALHLEVGCRHFDWQVAFAAQIINILRTPFSTVEHLTLEHRGNFKSSEPPNEDDLAQWRELLGPFDNVKALSVFGGFAGELSFTLTSDRGLPLELSPELKELLCPEGRGASHGHAISSFIDTHQNVAQPRLLFHTPLPVNDSLQVRGPCPAILGSFPNILLRKAHRPGRPRRPSGRIPRSYIFSPRRPCVLHALAQNTGFPLSHIILSGNMVYKSCAATLVRASDPATAGRQHRGN